MRKRIQNWLISSDLKQGERLPSVRTIAKVFGVATQTAYEALKELVFQQKIYSLQGKGFFWGVPPENPLPAKPKLLLVEALEDRFFADWKAGVYSPGKNLPSIKSLCDFYGVTSSTLRRLLNQLLEQRILARKGHGRFFFPEFRLVKNAEILLIARSDSEGVFHLYEERELAFLKEIYKEAELRELRLVLLGYDEKTNTLRDKEGNVCDVLSFSNCLGAILSTVLIEQPRNLFALFAKATFPVSVWWEHPLDLLPRSLQNKRRWAFFNLAFGSFPGKAVGRFLLERGYKRVSYISPFHLSSWSKDRLTGLRDSGLEVIPYVDDNHASFWDFLQEAKAKGFLGNTEIQAQKAVRERVQELLENKSYAEALVCVSDNVGEAILTLAREGKISKPPYLISFDNSVLSYMLRLDSFAFNLTTLVEQSVFHILSPNSNLYAKEKLRELSGKVVTK